MVSIRFSYLFDDNAFYRILSPIVPAAEDGNYQPLHDLAEQTMHNKPELWPLLDDLFLGPPFAEEGEQPSPRRLLMMVLAEYLQPIPTVNSLEEWQLIGSTLRSIGWSEDDIKWLQFGKSLCQLLVPSRAYNLNEYENRPQELPWCTGYVGWLDQETLQRFHDSLVQSKEAFMAFLSSSRNLEKILPVKNGEDRLVFYRRYEKKLVKAFAEADQVLTQCLDAQKALAIAVAG